MNDPNMLNLIRNAVQNASDKISEVQDKVDDSKNPDQEPKKIEVNVVENPSNSETTAPVTIENIKTNVQPEETGNAQNTVSVDLSISLDVSEVPEGQTLDLDIDTDDIPQEISVELDTDGIPQEIPVVMESETLRYIKVIYEGAKTPEDLKLMKNEAYLNTFENITKLQTVGNLLDRYKDGTPIDQILEKVNEVKAIADTYQQDPAVSTYPVMKEILDKVSSNVKNLFQGIISSDMEAITGKSLVGTLYDHSKDIISKKDLYLNAFGNDDELVKNFNSTLEVAEALKSDFDSIRDSSNELLNISESVIKELDSQVQSYVRIFEEEVEKNGLKGEDADINLDPGFNKLVNTVKTLRQRLHGNNLGILTDDEIDLLRSLDSGENVLNILARSADIMRKYDKNIRISAALMSESDPTISGYKLRDDKKLAQIDTSTVDSAISGTKKTFSQNSKLVALLSRLQDIYKDLADPKKYFTKAEPFELKNIKDQVEGIKQSIFDELIEEGFSANTVVSFMGKLEEGRIKLDENSLSTYEQLASENRNFDFESFENDAKFLSLLKEVKMESYGDAYKYMQSYLGRAGDYSFGDIKNTVKEAFTNTVLNPIQEVPEEIIALLESEGIDQFNTPEFVQDAFKQHLNLIISSEDIGEMSYALNRLKAAPIDPTGLPEGISSPKEWLESQEKLLDALVKVSESDEYSRKRQDLIRFRKALEAFLKDPADEDAVLTALIHGEFQQNPRSLRKYLLENNKLKEDQITEQERLDLQNGIQANINNALEELSVAGKRVETFRTQAEKTGEELPKKVSDAIAQFETVKKRLEDNPPESLADARNIKLSAQSASQTLRNLYYEQFGDSSPASDSDKALIETQLESLRIDRNKFVEDAKKYGGDAQKIKEMSDEFDQALSKALEGIKNTSITISELGELYKAAETSRNTLKNTANNLKQTYKGPIKILSSQEIEDQRANLTAKDISAQNIINEAKKYGADEKILKQKEQAYTTISDEIEQFLSQDVVPEEKLNDLLAKRGIAYKNLSNYAGALKLFYEKSEEILSDNEISRQKADLTAKNISAQNLINEAKKYGADEETLKQQEQAYTTISDEIEQLLSQKIVPKSQLQDDLTRRETEYKNLSNYVEVLKLFHVDYVNEDDISSEISSLGNQRAKTAKKAKSVENVEGFSQLESGKLKEYYDAIDSFIEKLNTGTITVSEFNALKKKIKQLETDVDTSITQLDPSNRKLSETEQQFKASDLNKRLEKFKTQIETAKTYKGSEDFINGIASQYTKAIEDLQNLVLTGNLTLKGYQEEADRLDTLRNQADAQFEKLKRNPIISPDVTEDQKESEISELENRKAKTAKKAENVGNVEGFSQLKSGKLKDYYAAIDSFIEKLNAGTITVSEFNDLRDKIKRLETDVDTSITQLSQSSPNITEDRKKSAIADLENQLASGEKYVKDSEQFKSGSKEVSSAFNELKSSIEFTIEYLKEVSVTEYELKQQLEAISTLNTRLSTAYKRAQNSGKLEKPEETLSEDQIKSQRANLRKKYLDAIDIAKKSKEYGADDEQLDKLIKEYNIVLIEFKQLLSKDVVLKSEADEISLKLGTAQQNLSNYYTSLKQSFVKPEETLSADQVKSQKANLVKRELDAKRIFNEAFSYGADPQKLDQLIREYQTVSDEIKRLLSQDVVPKEQLDELLTRLGTAYQNLSNYSTELKQSFVKAEDPVERIQQRLKMIDTIIRGIDSAINTVLSALKAGLNAVRKTITTLGRAIAAIPRTLTRIVQLFGNLGNRVRSVNALTNAWVVLDSKLNLVERAYNAIFSNQYLTSVQQTLGGISGLNQISGETANTIIEFAEAMEYAFGTPMSTMISQTSELALLMRSLGVQTENIANASLMISTVGLSLQASGILGGDYDAIMTKIVSGLRGETEAIADVGIDVRAKTLDDFVAKIKQAPEAFGLTADAVSNLANSTSQLTEKQLVNLRILAIYNQYVQNNGELLRNYAGYMDTVVGRVNGLKSAFTTLFSTVGVVIYQVVAAIGPYLEYIIRLITSAVSALAKLLGFETSWSELSGQMSGSFDSQTGSIQDNTEATEENTAAKNSNKGALASFDRITSIDSTSGSDSDKNSEVDLSGLLSGLPNMNDLLDQYLNGDSRMDALEEKWNKTFFKMLEKFQDFANTVTGHKIDLTFGFNATKFKDNIRGVLSNLEGIFKTIGFNISYYLIRIAEDLKIGKLLTGASEGLNTITGALKDVLLITGEISRVFYETFLSPIFKSAGESLYEWLTDGSREFSQQWVSSAKSLSKQLIEAMQSENPWENFIGVISEEFPLLGNLITLIESVSKAIGSVWETVSPLIGEFGQFAQDTIIPYLADTFERMATYIDENRESIQELLTALGEFAWDVVTTAIEGIGKVIDTIVTNKDLVMELLDGFSTAFKFVVDHPEIIALLIGGKAVTTVAGGALGAAETGLDIFSSLKGLGIIGGSAAGAAGAGTAGTGIGAAVGSGLKTVSSKASTILGKIPGVSVIGSKVSGVGASIGSTVMNIPAFQIVSSFFSQIGTAIAPIAAVAAPVLAVVAAIGSMIYALSNNEELMNRFKESLGRLWESLGRLWEALGRIWDLLSPIVELAGTLLVDALMGLADILGGTITAVSGLVDFIMGVITLDGDLIEQGVQEMFDGVVQILSGLWDAITNIFTDIKDSVTSILTGKGKSDVTLGESGAKKYFDSAAKGQGWTTERTNELWDQFKSQYSGNIENATNTEALDFLNQHLHAEGGIFSQPHYALFAEDGAEAVIPLSSKYRSKALPTFMQTANILGFNLSDAITSQTSITSIPSIGSVQLPQINTGLNKQDSSRSDSIRDGIEEALFGVINQLISQGYLTKGGANNYNANSDSVLRLLARLLAPYLTAQTSNISNSGFTIR